MKTLTRKTISAIKTYQMIENGDKIAVNLSGGKDSLMLVYILCEIKKCLCLSFDLIAITLDMCFENKCTDFSQVSSFCKMLGVSHYIKVSLLWDLIFVKRKEKSPCSLCSKIKKGILNDFATRLGCNKVALGHHFDDAVETLLLNLFYNGTFECFSPVTYLSRRNLTAIRPMIFCKESRILSCAKEIGLPVLEKLCPFDGKSKRESVKKILKVIESTLCPDIKDKLFHALTKSGISKW